MRPVACLSLMWLTLCFPGESRLTGQEWTRFRGPNGTGQVQAEGIPVEFESEHVLWKVTIPGKGHSQPVFHGDRIFLTSATDAGRKRSLFALRRSDGEKLWEKSVTFDTHKKHSLNSFASGSPTVDAERVYATFVMPERSVVLAFDHEGQEVWKRELGNWESQHGHGTSPIIHGEKLIIAHDHLGESFVVALDRKTGQPVWKTPRKSDRAAYGTPCLVEREGQRPELLFTSKSHGISSLDPETGKMNWEAPLFDKRSVSSPVVYQGRLAFGTCGSGGGGNYLVAVKLGGKGNVSDSHLAYRLNRSIPYVPTPVLAGELLFLWSDKGVVSCVEAASGEVLWQKRVGGQYYASPVCVNGKIYCVSTDGEVVVLGATREFQVLARNALDEPSHCTPAIADGRMYLRTFSSLICVGSKPAS